MTQKLRWTTNISLTNTNLPCCWPAWAHHRSAGVLGNTRAGPGGFSRSWAFKVLALATLLEICSLGEGFTLGVIQSAASNCSPSRDWEWILHLPTLNLCGSDWLFTLKISSITFFKWKLPIFYQDEKQTEIHCSNMMNTFLYLENWKTMECVLCSHVRAGPSRRQKLGDMLDVVAPTTCNKLTVRKTGKHQHQCSRSGHTEETDWISLTIYWLVVWWEGECLIKLHSMYHQ